MTQRDFTALVDEALGHWKGLKPREVEARYGFNHSSVWRLRKARGEGKEIGEVREPLLGQLESFVKRMSNNGGVAPEADSMAAEMEALAHDGREVDAERWYLRSLARLDELDVDEDRRTLYRDSVASAYGRVGYVLAERASAERAAAMRRAEDGAVARAEARRRAAKETEFKPRPSRKKGRKVS